MSLGINSNGEIAMAGIDFEGQIFYRTLNRYVVLSFGCALVYEEEFLKL